MKGAIFGDIIGSRFEFSKLRNNKSEDFELLNKKCEFTDDTVLTIATADAILNNKSFEQAYKEWGNMYPNCSYGNSFRNWLESDNPKPYNSFGNGSAMRVSPIGWLYNDLKTVMDKAEESARVTHNHIEGIKGASSIAACVYLARMKTPKKIIKEFIETFFDYDLNKNIEDIRPNYYFDETCQGSVPESIICFLEGKSYEDVVRKAVSLGGDTDTQACMAGSIAEAYYGGVPLECMVKLNSYLDKYLLYIIVQFDEAIKRGMIEDYIKNNFIK